MFKNSFKQIVVCMATFISFAVSAGSPGGTVAGNGGATEATQWMNNIELVKSSADGALTAQTTVNKYIMQAKQYENQLLNTIGIDPAVLQKNLADLNANINSANAFKSSLLRVQGSLQQQYASMDQKLIEARLMNLPWKDYVTRVVQQAANGNEVAKAKIKNEQDILSMADDDIADAQNQLRVIPSALGQEQSLQILNTQMNRMITQNARMIQVMARANGSDAANKEMDAQKAEMERVQAYDQYLANKKAMRARQAQEIAQ